MTTHLLFESPAGYALFKVEGHEEIGSKSAAVQEAISSLNSFSKMVHLVNFSPFEGPAQALENANDVSEGIINEFLQSCLEQHLPSKKSKVVLGVADRNLASSIKAALSVSCDSSDRTLDLLRGIRLHADKLIPGLDAANLQQAQLGLGHAYSRAKVKFNVNRSDNMIIQAIALLDQLDKDVNTFAMRVREWYGWHFPELVRVVPDNAQYAKLVQLIGDKSKLVQAYSLGQGSEEYDALLGQMTDILDGDEARAKSVFEAARTSMGTDISPIDLINISNFSARVINLYAYRASLQTYLAEKMSLVAPNLGALIGDTVAARLISHAGSLTNLSKYPASTVQILGAEKALFRALKTKGNTPKYGLIYHSSFIGRAVQKNKGRISRFLANKCSIASRIDCFSDLPSTQFGDALRVQVEERLAFYETGSAPTKNADAMQKVLTAMKQVDAEPVSEVINAEPEEADAKKSKKKKRKSEAVAAIDESTVDAVASELSEPKKKKKKKSEAASDAMDVDASSSSPKKSKKDKKEETSEVSEKKKKKDKKSKRKSEADVSMSLDA